MVSSDLDRRQGRAKLGFRQEALSAFEFLTMDHGFTCTQADLNLVSYESRTLYVLVYHDPLSYEVGVDVGKLDNASERRPGVTLMELVRLANPRRAQNFRYPAVVRREQMRPALGGLAGLLSAYGGRVLGGDLSVLKRVRRERASVEKESVRASRLLGVRTKAHAAFREEDYPRAAALYGSIQGDLGPTEIGKLEYAKRRARRAGFPEG